MKHVWVPLAVVSAFSYAVVVICDKLGTRHIDSTVMGVIQVATTLMLLVGMLVYSNKWTELRMIDKAVMPYLLASAVCTAIYYVSYYVIIKWAPVSDAAILDQLSLIFIIYLAMIFLGEAITWKTVIGSIFFILGIGFMTW